MARLIGPDEASRRVDAEVGKVFQSKTGSRAQLWADDAATIPADVLWPDGTPIPLEQPANNGGRGLAPTVTVDAGSMLPLVQYPPGDVDWVVVTCDGGPPWRAYARTDDRLDQMFTRYPDANGQLSIVETSGSFNAGSFEHTGAAAALRLRQSGTGPIAKWRSGTTDTGFIQNHGGLQLLPLDDGYALRVETPTWSASRPFEYGNKAGLFFVDNFVDNSGIPTVAGVYQSYTKLFGAGATKNGPGNLDAFWATINHHGPDEAGLFIGDVTGDSGGNVWGGHFKLTANTVEALMVGLELDVIKNVAGSTKETRGLHIRSGGTQDATYGLLIDSIPSAAGSWTSFIAARNSGGTVLFQVDKAGSVTASSAADGAQIMRLAMDRPWAFRQQGTAGAAVLRLAPDTGPRTMRITSPDAAIVAFEVQVADVASSSIVKIAPTAGQKIGFFDAAPVARQTGLPVASTDLPTVVALANFLRTALLNLGLVTT
ncbi:hypothetical protein JNW88_28170 [Micromonospora sp. ATA32]|nr:hypothetical protein [Micromonospora sp. ATA32]